MFLRPMHHRGDYNFPTQPEEEVLARWTELVFIDRGAASSAPLRNCAGRVCSNTVRLNSHRALAIDHGPLFLCFSSIFGKRSGARVALRTSLIT